MKDYFDKLVRAFKDTIITRKNSREVIDYSNALELIITSIIKARENRNRAYFIGNGGSAGIALHMAADYLKSAGICTQTFYDPTLLTCMGNDYGYESVFSHPIDLCSRQGDILIAISSSGRSRNILNAVTAAQENGCTILTLSGFDHDNSLRSMGDINIYVPISEYGIVESIHNLILQQIVDEIKYREQ